MIDWGCGVCSLPAVAAPRPPVLFVTKHSDDAVRSGTIVSRCALYLGAGAFAGAVAGLAVGTYLVANNFLGGSLARAGVLLLCVVGYGAACAVPLGLFCATFDRLIGAVRPAARATSAESASIVRFGRAAGIAIVTIGCLAAVRYIQLTLARAADGVSVATLVASAATGAGVLLGSLVLAWGCRRFAASVSEGAHVLGPGAFGALALVVALVTLTGSLPQNSRPAIAQNRSPEIRTSQATGLAFGEERRKLALIGFDGLDPDILALLIEAGDMPTFARLHAEGADAHLETLTDGLSPPVWATMATGVSPSVHRVHNFFFSDLRFFDADLTALRIAPIGFAAHRFLSAVRRSPLVNNGYVPRSDWRAPAVWQIASQAGLRTDVVGWLSTWPAPQINGTAMSDRAYYWWNHGGLVGGTDGGAETVDVGDDAASVKPGERPAGLCEPEPACLSLIPPARTDGPVDPTDSEPFYRGETEFSVHVARELLGNSYPDFFAFYSRLPDFLNHKLTPEELDNVRNGRFVGPGERQARAIYQEVDATLAKVLELIPAESAVMVVSDHGVDLIEDGSFREVTHFNGPDGIFAYRASSGRARPQLNVTPSVYTVAPTALAVLGVPVPEPLADSVLRDIVDVELGPDALVLLANPALIASSLPSPTAAAAAASSMDKQDEARLRALGYIE